MIKARLNSHYQLKNDKVEQKRIKRAKTIKIFDPNFLTYLLKNRLKSYYQNNVLS
jgi:hypothetical protein